MFQSIPHMLFQTIQKVPDKDALRYRRNNRLNAITYEQFGRNIRHLAYALDESGIQKKDKVAILSNNRPEWSIADFAVMALGSIVIPIYQTLPPGHVRYILKDAEVSAVFVENLEQYEKIEEIRKDLPELEFVFSFDPVIGEVETIEDLYKRGESGYHRSPDFFENRMNEIDPDDICTYVYTSGTTGNPKGVMLFHRGFIEEIISSEAQLNLADNEVFLSFLPLSHLYERVAGHWTPMYRTNTIHYARSIEKVIDDVAEARPTVIVSVPRLFEKIASRVIEQIEHGSAAKRKIFYWAMKQGTEYHLHRVRGKVPYMVKKRFQMADRLVFKKIKEKLGGRLKYPIAGGAPLAVDTLKFFESFDMQIIEGYGMTETHLIITLTPFGESRYGSCGKPINKVNVRVAEDGEILVKSPMVMAGYYKQPEMIKEIIDEDGWLHTGDIGYLDDEKYLFITDRKKNFLVTSGGKNIAASPIEAKLKNSKYIDDVCLVGDRLRFISALVVPNFENLKKWASFHKFKYQNEEELLQHAAVREFIWQEVVNQQKDLPRFEKVKKIALLTKPFSIEYNELTPSQKIKRKVIQENYKELIEKIYRAGAVTS